MKAWSEPKVHSAESAAETRRNAYFAGRLAAALQGTGTVILDEASDWSVDQTVDVAFSPSHSDIHDVVRAADPAAWKRTQKIVVSGLSGTFIVGRVASGITLGRLTETAALKDVADSQLAHRFRELAGEWTRETAMESSTSTIVMHRAYQRIIGLGPRALPLILRELRDRPAYWFWALAAIAGEDPAAGIERFDEARRAWLTWGEHRGYL
jgi:hypothetical protein